jgi:periplasmic divalent cation tolerance protein
LDFNMSISVVYVTSGNREEAQSIGRTLVEERLVACANIVSGMHSIYWWEGAMETSDELVVFMKTRTELVEAVAARVRELHSYDVPCVVSWPIASANPDYVRWVEGETRGA